MPRPALRGERRVVNTPGHAVVSVALLGRGRATTLPLVAGAIAPDVTLFLFYLWQRLVLDVPEHVIWGTLYFESRWQVVFDVGHSLPLAALAGGIAWLRRAPRATAFFASVALHALLDLPLHHDDAHRHFLPFSSWRFESPLSYWDPRHYGGVVAGLEGLVVVIAAGVAWRRVGWIGRGALVGTVALYATAYWAFYVVGWVGR